MAESFALQSPQGPPQLLRLVPDHMWSEVSIGTASIALLAQLLREIEDKRDRQNMKFARQFDKRFARVRLNIGRIDYRESAPRQPLPRDEMQNLERITGGRLIVLIVGNQAAAEVR